MLDSDLADAFLANIVVISIFRFVQNVWQKHVLHWNCVDSNNLGVFKGADVPKVHLCWTPLIAYWIELCLSDTNRFKW